MTKPVKAKSHFAGIKFVLVSAKKNKQAQGFVSFDLGYCRLSGRP